MIDYFVMTLIAATGLTMIVVRSKLFEPLRLYLKDGNPTISYAINCSQCIGFWAGLLFGAATFISIYFAIAMAFSVSLTTMLADKYYFTK